MSGTFVAVALLSSTSYAADEPKGYPSCGREPTENDVAAAKGAFEAGQVSFQEADYDRAILYWEDAFRRDCTAAPLLLNLSRAYELSGQRKSAIVTLETFLERRPDHADRASIEKRIAALKRQVEEDEAKPVVAAPPKTETPPPSESKTDEVEEGDEPESPSSGKPAWPVIVTGTGAGVGILGALFAVAGQKTLDTCPKDASGQRVCVPPATEEEARKGESARNLGLGMAVVGGAAALTGGVFWIITWNNAPETPVSATAKKFTPVFGSDFTGLTFQSAF